MRIVFVLLGNALMLLGVSGLLLLSAGRFPEPVRNLLLGPPPGARFQVAPTTLAVDGSVQDVPLPAEVEEPPATMLAGELGMAGADPTGAGPGAAEVAATEPTGEPDDEAQQNPTPVPSPTPRPLPPTRTPVPTVLPVTLAAGQTRAPITRLHVPSIRLDTEVVPARLVAAMGVTTWEVPALRAGHGLHTAGAGEPGNAVLVGHVSSISHGNVFRSLDRVRVGDVVQVFSNELGYDYLATEVKRVPRTDLAILAPTDGAAVTLLTCIGQWLPDVDDYAERLIVRAVLVAAHQTPTATASPTPTASPTSEASPTLEATTTPEASPTPDSAPQAPPPPAGTDSTTLTIRSTATPPPTQTATATAAATATQAPPPAATATRAAVPGQATAVPPSVAATAAAPTAAAPTASGPAANRTAQATAPATTATAATPTARP